MLPPCRRVKLNRAALNDAAEHKAPASAAPRRRRIHTLVSCTAEPPENEEKFPTPGRKTGSEPGGFNPDKYLLTHHQKGSGNVTGARERSCSGPRTGNCVRMLKPEEQESTDVDRKPAVLSGSDGFLSKAAESSSRHLCLEGKYPSRQRETSRKRVIQSVSSEGSPAARKTQQKSTSVNWYPKVNLCNVAERWDSCRCRCSYVLPAVLRTKSVRCFKKDMRAGFRFSPQCFRHMKHEGDNETLVKKPSGVQLNGSLGRSLTKHQNVASGSRVTYNHTTRRFPNDSTSEASAVSGSVLDTYTSRAGCNAGRDVEQCFGPRSVVMGAEIHKDIEDRSSTLAERGDPTKVWGTLKSSEHENDILTDDPESFTCQRVKAYLRKMPSSCARTCISWPFVNGLSRPDHQSARDVGNSKADKQPRRHSPCRQTDSTLSNASIESDGERCDPLTSRQSRTEMEMEPDGLSSSPLPFNGPASTSCVSCPSPASLALSDWETTPILSPLSSPFSRGSLSSLCATPSRLPPPSFQLDTAQGVPSRAGETLCSSLSSSSQDSDCSNSSLILPQDKHKSDEEPSEDGSLPKTARFIHLITAACSGESSISSIPDERAVESDCLLPPVHSPVSSLETDLWRRSSSRQSSGHSDAGTNEVAPHKNAALHSYRTSQIASDNGKSFKDYFVKDIEDTEGVLSFKSRTSSPGEDARSSPSSDGEVGNGSEEERGDETDFEDDAERGNRSSEQDPTDPKTKRSLPSGALSSDDGNSTDEGSLPSAREGSSSPSIAGSEGDQTQAAGGSQPGFLDEITAYEQDILLVDVFQDDPELFDNLPEQQTPLKLGPAPKNKPAAGTKERQLKTQKTSMVCEQRWTSIPTNLPNKTRDITDETNGRPWRPQTGVAHGKHPGPDGQSQSVAQSDANSNRVNGILARSQTPAQTASSTHNIPPLMSLEAGPPIKNPTNATDCRRLKSDAYCGHYFSESLSCAFKKCRFRHLPAEGDEKFCVQTVARLTQNPASLQKAGAVFTGYYQNNPPGTYFSTSVLLMLLWALLKAGMVSEVFSVLNVSLAHSIVPSHDFLLALFNRVRENSLTGFIPELMQLTFKMADSGLGPSLNFLDYVKDSTVFQRFAPLTSSDSSNHKFPATVAFPEDLNLAHIIVEIELCIKQEDWKQLAVAFISICQSSQHPNQVERISGRVAIALLSKSKDKLSPFAAFVETACGRSSSGGEDDPIKTYVGRIGVSLMLCYHKTHEWMKGRKVVETLSLSKVDYSTLKGLFGNEDRVSRCHLITVATELFLMTGSVEGALNTLRENKWFLSSCSWPCEAADLESRTRVMCGLAEKTSHRDKLDVLCNLPGVKESDDLLDVSKYSLLFNAHLQVCVDRQIFPVAVDTVDFMLAKKLLVGGSLLQVILSKLGRQNHWLRARELFRRALSLGYYPEVSAPPGVMALTVPCRLGEEELVLAFEMFLTVNASSILLLKDSATLTITLKRTQSSESEYLSAGSRLFSAASIPQPKLIVHYNAVNSSQEQVFTLDWLSARRWLHSNHLWARDMWKQ